MKKEFKVVYDDGPESTHVFDMRVPAEDAEDAVKIFKQIFPDSRVLGVLLLNSNQAERICNPATYRDAVKIEDEFRETIRDNIVSYEPMPFRVR